MRLLGWFVSLRFFPKDGYFRNSSCTMCLERWIRVGQKLICFCWGLHIYSRCFGYELCSWNSYTPCRESRKGSGSAGKKAENSNLCVHIKIYLKIYLKTSLIQPKLCARQSWGWGAWGGSSPSSALYMFYRLNQSFQSENSPSHLLLWAANSISSVITFHSGSLFPEKGLSWDPTVGKKEKKKKGKLDFPLGLNSLSDWSCKSEQQWE